MLEFLISHKVLLVHGSAFNWPAPDHMRIVSLPVKRDLVMAINRFGDFLQRYAR